MKHPSDPVRLSAPQPECQPECLPKRLPKWFAILAAACGTLPALNAQSVLEIISPPTGGCLEARGVSADGQIVVGTGQTSCPLAFGPPSNGFTWSPSTGVVIVPELDVIYAVNGDGSVLIGRQGLTPGTAFALDSGGLQALGVVPSPEFGSCTSDAGDVVAGELTSGAGGGYQPAGAAAVDVTCDAPCSEVVSAVSADGAVLVGHRDESPASAMRWFVSGGSEVIVPGAGDDEYQAQACNADGSVVFGSHTDLVTGLDQGFRWTEANGLELLGGIGLEDLANVTFRAASDDGTLAVGQIREVSAIRAIPAVWSEATGLLKLEDLLIEQGTDMQDMILWRASDVSADGRWVVGWAEETFAPFDNPGYRIDLDLPWSNLGGGLAGTPGVPRLIGGGSPLPGNPMSVQLSGALPNTGGVVIAGFSAFDPALPIAGGLLFPFPDIAEPVFVDGNGELSIGFNWALAAQDVFVQFWLVDPAGPEGLSASNALAVSAF